MGHYESEKILYGLRLTTQKVKIGLCSILHMRHGVGGMMMMMMTREQNRQVYSVSRSFNRVTFLSSVIIVSCSLTRRQNS